jgi:gamma-glutamylcyclotransferase (GGCT)/AIG2-like uncharacterized protein YtfP
MSLIFVYGTLKQGGSNHHFLAGQSFLGKARTVPGYLLYEITGYPGMVRQDDCLEGVSGEVWAVDAACLAGLDLLEGTADGVYRREAVPLEAPFAGQKVEAYVYLRSIEDRRKAGPEWGP